VATFKRLKVQTFQWVVGVVALCSRLPCQELQENSGTYMETETGTGKTQYMVYMSLRTTTYCGVF
jgi:hypothetical protein